MGGTARGGRSVASPEPQAGVRERLSRMVCDRRSARAGCASVTACAVGVGRRGWGLAWCFSSGCVRPGSL